MARRPRVRWPTRMGRIAFGAALWLCIGWVTWVDSAMAEPAQSVARRWNEALLEAIRNDYARPTVHARNLFHVSAAMYDAWAVFDDVATPYLLGRRIGFFTCGFTGIGEPADAVAARREAISYAAYRLLVHRFSASPEARGSINSFRTLMSELGYNPNVISTDYSSGSAAALGNYIAQCMIDFGLQDGSNELLGYASTHYRSVNPPLAPAQPGNPLLRDPNRWQSFSLQVFIDQAGHVLPGNTPYFLGPEWGSVVPFALDPADRALYERDGYAYSVYSDPGPPPQLAADGSGTSDDYKWNFALVALWSSHLDPTDGVLWDISPGALGGVEEAQRTVDGLKSFYRPFEGGDIGEGRALNPHTGRPYDAQVVPRGDYARVLAEFWADGPSSETPPGHWFVLLNYVNDQPELQRRLRGEGSELGHLEWDIKAYMALGGAMHDAAITAWGIKGWYDYIRPVSALRGLADRGQSTARDQPNYAADGMPLYPGFIEVIGAADSLAGDTGEHVGKIKMRAWRGPQYVGDPGQDVAGVGWIRAENWWPYQRSTFVTPPFAGYVSGHATYSRAAAEVLTLLTGDPYFPGGLASFVAPRDAFLTFEKGPSVDVVLQWATYRDAADQCSLSRIWGGIHPPIDDMPGRRLGAEVGRQAFVMAERHFSGQLAYRPIENAPRQVRVRPYPNPYRRGQVLWLRFDQTLPDPLVEVLVYNVLGQRVHRQWVDARRVAVRLPSELSLGSYFLRVRGDGWQATSNIALIE
jgi:hypothetical protein